jgi:hypothetical protein
MPTPAHVSVWVSPHLSFLATSFTSSRISHLLKAVTYACNGTVFLFYFITLIKGLQLIQECSNTILKKQNDFQLANNNANANRHLMLTNTLTVTHAS